MLLLLLLLLLTSIESFKLTEEAITLPILPSSFTILGFFVILMYVLELLLTFLCASLVPKICKLPAEPNYQLCLSTAASVRF
jgi:hypothetical protein